MNKQLFTVLFITHTTNIQSSSQINVSHGRYMA